METLHTLFVLGMLVFVFFVLPIALIALFLQMRAKSRLAMLQGPWTTLAQQFGGQLEGERVRVTRDVYQMTLGMELVSVMQAVGSPYYRDGGTYTEARLHVDPRSGVRLVDKPLAFTRDALPHALGASPFAQLPASARTVIFEHEARVVLAGAVDDLRAIGSAFASLQALVENARTHGPVPAAA